MRTLGGYDPGDHVEWVNGDGERIQGFIIVPQDGCAWCARLEHLPARIDLETLMSHDSSMFDLDALQSSMLNSTTFHLHPRIDRLKKVEGDDTQATG